MVPTLGFTGHVNDWDSGLGYMQQRYYDPVAWRFLSTDWPHGRPPVREQKYYKMMIPREHGEENGGIPRTKWVHGGAAGMHPICSRRVINR